MGQYLLQSSIVQRGGDERSRGCQTCRATTGSIRAGLRCEVGSDLSNKDLLSGEKHPWRWHIRWERSRLHHLCPSSREHATGSSRWLQSQSQRNQIDPIGDVGRMPRTGATESDHTLVHTPRANRPPRQVVGRGRPTGIEAIDGQTGCYHRLVMHSGFFVVYLTANSVRSILCFSSNE